MAFTVADFDDLARLLAEHPEWRERLRPLILGDEILALPGLMTGVFERLDRIEAVLELMAARQDEFDRRMVEFDQRLIALEASIDRLTERIDKLVETAELHASRMNRMDGRMGSLEGQLLELRYERNIRNWATAYYRPVEHVYVDDLDLLESSVDAGVISRAEVTRLLDADMLFRGRPRSGGAEMTIVAVEISQTINREDVDRANDHALTLRRAGYTAAALVGGTRIGEEVEPYAASLGVTVDLRRMAA
jgi:hypothetical protein